MKWRRKLVGGQRHAMARSFRFFPESHHGLLRCRGRNSLRCRVCQLCGSRAFATRAHYPVGRGLFRIHALAGLRHECFWRFVMGIVLTGANRQAAGCRAGEPMLSPSRAGGPTGHSRYASRAALPKEFHWSGAFLAIQQLALGRFDNRSEDRRRRAPVVACPHDFSLRVRIRP